MRIAQINVVASLSTGRIAVALSRMVMANGHRALICHSRDHAPADVPSYRIGSMKDTYVHLALSRLSDRTGFFSRHATQKLIRQLEAYQPDIIHLHNLHGYYLHLPILFSYLKQKDLPVVWTLHDCWAYTGHCAYYTMAVGAPSPEGARRRRAQGSTVGCERWLNGCGKCVLKRSYPASWFCDQSARNWREKRELFSGLQHMVLCTPSDWLQSEVKRSFLAAYPTYVLPNGIDLTAFRPCPDEAYMDDVVKYYKLDQSGGRKLVLSVAAVWDERKGLDDLIELGEALGDGYCVAAVGLDENQIKSVAGCPILGVKRTGNLNDLCALYTAADVYVSTSHEETMGMTLVEALACGTQVLCYDATAMPEIVTDAVGEVVPLGDIAAMADAVRRLCDAPKSADSCRERAGDFDQERRFAAYMRLYENMYQSSPAYKRAVQAAAAPATDD